MNFEQFKRYNSFSKEDQLKLLRENGWMIRWINSPSEELQLVAIKKHPFSIQYIEDPSEEAQLEAVKEFYIINNIKQFIKNPCQKVLDLAMIKDIIE